MEARCKIRLCIVESARILLAVVCSIVIAETLLEEEDILTLLSLLLELVYCFTCELIP